MSHFYLLNIWTFLYFQNRFIVFQLELLTWLLIHFWCNKSRLWFRFNIEHVSFGFLIYYYTINLSSWTITLHSLETTRSALVDACRVDVHVHVENSKISVEFPVKKFHSIFIENGMSHLWKSSGKLLQSIEVKLNFHFKKVISVRFRNLCLNSFRKTLPGM